VGNEENGYTVPDPNKAMIKLTKEPSDAPPKKKNHSNRKSWKKYLRNSWRIY
jgi:hypothetical protein